MALKDQVNGSTYEIATRTAMMSSDSQTAYQVNWANESSYNYHPSISIADYDGVGGSAASKVMYRANSNPGGT